MHHRKDVIFTKPSIYQPGIEEYAEHHTTAPPSEVTAIAKRTATDCPEWADIASSSLQASFLTMLVELVGARRALEVGTFTGHATLAIAAALPPDGRIVTVDNFVADAKARDIALSAFADSPHGHKVELIEADAAAALNELDGPFDLIFVDADKPNYMTYYERILGGGLLAPHGLLVIDNTLWGGEVVHPSDPDGPLEEAANGHEWVERLRHDWGRHVVAFNDRVAADPRTETVLLPVHDGTTLVRLAR